MDWKVKRSGAEFPCPDTETLKQWSREGRIQPEDYVFNPVLDQWLYAKDAAELTPIFQRSVQAKRSGSLNALGLTFGILGMVLMLTPLMPLGALLFLLGIVFTILYYVKRP